MIDALTAQAEFAPTRLGRAGASIVADAERYLEFFAIAQERSPAFERVVAASDLRGRI